MDCWLGDGLVWVCLNSGEERVGVRNGGGDVGIQCGGWVERYGGGFGVIYR